MLAVFIQKHDRGEEMVPALTFHDLAQRIQHVGQWSPRTSSSSTRFCPARTGSLRLRSLMSRRYAVNSRGPSVEMRVIDKSTGISVAQLPSPPLRVVARRR